MTAPKIDWVLERIKKLHDRSSFSCGKPVLDEYLEHFARQNDENNIGYTYVAVKQGAKAVIGYFTISFSSVEFEEFPKNLTMRLPRYPIPCVLIGKLAVDRSVQGRGLGRLLLWEALRMAVEASAEIAAYAVIVDAVDEEARRFYLHNGFAGLPVNKKRLAVSIRSLREVIRGPKT